MKNENLILAAIAGLGLAWWLWHRNNQVAASVPVQQSAAGNGNYVLTPAGTDFYNSTPASGGSTVPGGTTPAGSGGLSSSPAVLYTAGTGGGSGTGAIPSGSNTPAPIGNTKNLPIVTAAGKPVPISQVDHNVSLSALINSALLKNRQISLSQLHPSDYIIHPAYLNLQ